MKKSTLVVMMTSIISFAILAIMVAIFAFGKMKMFKDAAISSMSSEIETLRMYESLQDRHIQLQIEHLNMLEEYNDYIYINSGQAEADSIYNKI